MNDFDPSLNPPAPAATSRARLEGALSAIVDQYGPSLFFEPDRLKAYLDDACPDAPKGISLVLLALTEAVPQQLLAAHSDADLRTLLPRLVQQLTERSVFDAPSATWVVRAWTHALALPTIGLDGAPPVMRAAPATVVDFASIVTPMTHRKPAVPPGVQAVVQPVLPPEAAPVFAAPVQPEATPPAMDIELRTPPASDPPPLPRAEPIEVDASVMPASLAAEVVLPSEPVVPAPEHVPAETAAAIVEPVDRPQPEPVVATPSLPEPIVVEPAVVAPSDVEPASVEPAVVEPEAASPPLLPEPIVVPVEPVATPTWARPAHVPPPARARSSRGRAVGIGVAVLLAIIAVIGLNRRDASSPDTPQSPAIARNDVPVATAPPEPAPSPAMPDRPATTTGATATESAPATSTPSAAIVEPEKVTTTTSDASLPPPLANVQAPPPSSEPAPAPVAPPPVVAISKPDTPAPPTIARIDVPHAAPGKPLLLAIHVDLASSAELSLVERRVVDGSVPMRSTPASSLERARKGVLLYPVDASERAAGNTLQFNLVDRQGHRGPARRVSLRTETMPQAAAVECTRTTCGSVVAVREAGRVFETIIRMDDRSIHTVAQPSRWRTGARVRMSGSQFTPVASDRR